MNRWTGKLIGGILGFFIFGPFGMLFGIFMGHMFFDNRGKSISGKTWGGILGLMFAGPLGAIAGVYFGNSFDQQRRVRGGVDDRSVFQINLISILAYVVKVDHEIKEEEVQTILGVFRKMGSGPLQMEIIKRTLVFALNQPIDLQSICANFKKVAKYEECLMLLRIVHMVVMADNVVHPNEKQAIEDIVRFLGIGLEDYRSLQGEFSRTHDRNYELLGLKRGATRIEVKRAYRKLALTHHPDRVSHLGEEYVNIAREKFQEINGAYHTILKEVSA